jgi:hypothetical protein
MSIRTLPRPDSYSAVPVTPETVDYRVKNVDIARAKARSAVPLSADAQKLRLSKKLALSKSFQQCTVVCPISGIVSLLDIPTIPGYTLIYENPLTDVRNVEGICTRGKDYLELLDTQVLAGMFIVLLSHYDLFRDTPASTGAERNALLRSAGKPLLIETLLVVNNWVHHGNIRYIPGLSLVYSKEMVQTSMQARVSEWLKLVIDSIVRPDTAEYNHKSRAPKITFSSVEKVSRKERRTKEAESIDRKFFLSHKKEARDIILALPIPKHKKQILEDIFTGNMLLTAPTENLEKLAQKIEAIEHRNAKRLAEIVRFERKALRDKELSFDPFADTEMSALQASPADVIAAVVATAKPAPVRTAPEVDEGKEAAIHAIKTINPEPSYTGLSFTEKLIARKKWEEKIENLYRAQQRQNDPAAANAPAVSLHSYVPSAEKQKLGQEGK